MKKNMKTNAESSTTSIKDTSYSQKEKKYNLKLNSNEIDPMDDLDKEKINQKEAVEDPDVEIDSEKVKVTKIANSKLLKVYYWKKENVTIAAIGKIGIEKRQGDQTKELQKEYSKLGTDQMLKIFAAMAAAQEATKKH